MAYFTKGLGDVVADELAEILGTAGGQAGEPGERFAVVETTQAGVDRVLARARTIDDFRVLVAGPRRVSGEGEFAALCSVAARRTEALLATDPARARAPWSVTLSARHPPWSARPGWSTAGVVARAFHGADVGAAARAPVDLRVQVDGEVMHVAASLGGRVAGQRAGQEADRGPPWPGALRPSVAAAMVRMALAAGSVATRGQGGRPGTLYDPFAGSGTIVAEAWRAGLRVFASDVDPEAVRMTRERMERLTAAGPAGRRGQEASLSHRIFVHDIRRGVPGRVRAELVAGNMPWGQQVAVPRREELFDATARLAREVVAAGGVAVLLTTHEQQFRGRLRRVLPGARVTVRRIGLLGQTPALVLVQPT